MRNKPARKLNNNGAHSEKKAGRGTSETKSETKANGALSKDEAPLTKEEKATLQQLETAISSGFASFVKVGSALNNINTLGLYRGECKTFNSYCVQHWQITRTYAYRLINAAVCYDLLEDKLPTPAVRPRNESQLRPIVGTLKQDQWVKAWKQVLAEVGSAAPTAKAVAKVVKTMLGKTAAKTGQIRKKLRKNMPNKTVAKIEKLVEKALGNKSPTIGKLKAVLEIIQNNLKSLHNGTAS